MSIKRLGFFINVYYTDGSTDYFPRCRAIRWDKDFDLCMLTLENDNLVYICRNQIKKMQIKKKEY